MQQQQPQRPPLTQPHDQQQQQTQLQGGIQRQTAPPSNYPPQMRPPNAGVIPQQFVPGMPPQMYGPPGQFMMPQPFISGQLPRPVYNPMINQQLSAPPQLSQQAAKFGPQPTLKDQCSKHQNQIVIFTDQESGQSYCEICYKEYELSQGKVGHEAQSIDIEEVKTGDQEALQNKQEPQLNKTQQIHELKQKLESILASLSAKIRQKTENLILSHERYSLYENTLNQKFNPVFQQMKENIQDKRLEYMTFLIKQLNQNKDRVQLEKETIEKLVQSFFAMSDKMRKQLEDELDKVKKIDENTKKQLKRVKDQEGADEHEDDAEDAKSPEIKVDSYKIEALSTMLDDFENIISKNFCLFSNQEDFSFASSRSKEKLAKQFQDFAELYFTGNFVLKDWFQQGVLPRICFLQQGTKLMYIFKILHSSNECTIVNSTFSFPIKARSLVTPNGQVYQIGGYLPLIKHFSKNIFILDEYRYQLVPLQTMKEGRADHSLLYFRGNIYVFGGMNFANSQNNTVRSLNTCEVYNVQKDTWTDIPTFQTARQQFSVCSFNDKYFFIFGGKKLKNNAVLGGLQPYDFVNEVEVYDIDRSSWKVINYISDTNRLRLLNPSSLQIVAKKIMIFGGLYDVDSESRENIQSLEEHQDQIAVDSNHRVAISNICWHLDVTTGQLQKAADMIKPAYFLSGGQQFTHSNIVYCFGIGLGKDQQNQGISHPGEEVRSFLIPNQNRKVILSYKVEEGEWKEFNEGFYSRRQIESLDEQI